MYDALLEDEDNIFGGSVRSKYHDILQNASSELVVQELDRQIKRMAVMEELLEEHLGHEYNEHIIKLERAFEHPSVETRIKSLYIECMGNIVTQNE
jgi:hypothetical protein